jgi:hypothetical protein
MLIAAKLARAISGNTIRNIAGTLLMVIEEPPTGLVAMRVSSREVAEELAVVVEPVARVELVEQAELAAQEVPEVLAA